MLNLIIRGFITSIDILPLSRFDGKRPPSHLSQRIEIAAPALNSNFSRALQGIKNVQASFAAQCPPRSLSSWTPPTPQSGLLRIDFVTPYLSSDDSLPLTTIDTADDPDGVLEGILAKSQGKFYTEDNKVEYLKMKTKDGVHSVEPLPPLQVRPGQLVELGVGFLVIPTGKAKLSLKRRLFSVCVLETSLQEEFNSIIPRSPKPSGKQTVRRFSPYGKRTDKVITMDEDK